MNIEKLITGVLPFMFRIETPYGNGSGFAFCRSDINGGLLGIATASHVIFNADKWRTPMRIYNTHRNVEFFLRHGDDYSVLPHPKNDSAVIIVRVPKASHLFDNGFCTLLEQGARLPLGHDVHWLGYPGIPQAPISNPSFFSGKISSINLEHSVYLIDGVSIHGLSGGPVFCSFNDQLRVVGTNKSYHPNRTVGGEAWPGLMGAQDVSYFHDFLLQLKDLEEIEVEKEKRKKEEWLELFRNYGSGPPVGLGNLDFLDD